MLTDLLLVLTGLLALLIAGELLVRGAVDLARALHIPALIVSLTIVAFGTSAPEIVVSIQAVLNGSAGIALGNIVGSNIANILMVLGIPAIIYPISTNVDGLKKHTIVMGLATIAFAMAAYLTGKITFMIGAALFTALIIYISYMLIDAMRGRGNNPVLDEVEEFSDGDGLRLSTFVFIIVGLIGLPLGANLLVTHGSILASSLGVRDAVIGLTVIAFGTSLPELATVLSAAVKKKADVAIGSIVGSNIFNLLAVGGVTGLVGGASFDPASLHIDLPVMIFATVILCIFIFPKINIGRFPGMLMAAAYIGFIYYIATQTLI